jgi:hypothetical protein
MKRIPTRPCLATALLLAFGAWLIGPRFHPPAAPAAPQPATVRAAPSLPAGLSGTASCSGRSCHGRLEALPDAQKPWVRQDEYTVWLTQDSHAESFRTLAGALSRRIMRALRRTTPANQDLQCLSCHINPALAEVEVDSTIAAERRMGIGCEACHGPAAKWLEVHTTWKPRQVPAQEKDSLRMIPIAEPTRLAEVCTGCHIGASNNTPSRLREVDHDLIAAGHPPLQFELREYLGKMPAHWREPAWEGGQERLFQTLGQLGSARAAVRLLKDRATRKGTPWPEFAEYDCTSCHHNLSGSQRPANADGRPGALRWGSQYFPAPPARGAQAFEEAGDLVPRLNALRREMSRPTPDRQAVLQAISEVEKRLTAETDRLRKRR